MSQDNCNSLVDRDQSGVSMEDRGPAAHPLDPLLRPGRIPHIWCSGCGLGVVLTAYLKGIQKAGLDLDKVSVVSGIGCTGRIAGYINLDSFHTTHGRAIPFAMGLKIANPELKVVVFSGDGDLTAIGGNHLIHAARRNVDLTVICINNFNYGMTGGQSAPTSQAGARTATTPRGNLESSFNLPYLLAAAGATYVARWTVLDLGRLRRSMMEALAHKGFSFVEVISPCPIYYGRFNRMGDALSELRYYRDNTVLKNFAPLPECDLSVLGGKIVVGKFVEEQKPVFMERQKVEA